MITYPLVDGRRQWLNYNEILTITECSLDVYLSLNPPFISEQHKVAALQYKGPVSIIQIKGGPELAVAASPEELASAIEKARG